MVSPAVAITARPARINNQSQLLASSEGAAVVAVASSVTVKVGLAAVALASSGISASVFAVVGSAAVALASSGISSSSDVVTTGVPAGVTLPVLTTAGAAGTFSSAGASSLP